MNRENLYDTNLPYVQIKKRDLDKKYELLGSGQEAQVYGYNNELAMKLLTAPTKEKFEKIEMMSKYYDDSILFPCGLVGFATALKEGYLMDRIHFSPLLNDFEDLKYLYYLRDKLEIIKKCDRVIRRAHRSGIIFGDIKSDNILIDDKMNPRFCDADNYKFGDEFDYDLPPDRANWLSQLYKRSFDEKDSDKFVYALLVLEVLLGKRELNPNLDDINNALKELDNKLLRDGFREMLSDSDNKPYVSEVLDGISEDDIIIKI